MEICCTRIFVTKPGVAILPAVPSSDVSGADDHRRGRRQNQRAFPRILRRYHPQLKPRAAYVQAIAQFCRWCEEHDLRFASIRPLHVSAYIEAQPLTAPSIKQ